MQLAGNNRVSGRAGTYVRAFPKPLVSQGQHGVEGAFGLSEEYGSASPNIVSQQIYSNFP